MNRADCIGMDAADPLAPVRDHFVLPPGVIYLDGNSLGALPKAVPPRLRQVIEVEWGEGLVGSWDRAGWIDRPALVGDLIAPLVGAGAGEVIACDSTSVNLYKLVVAAARARPGRRVLLTERGNFPTDVYVAESAASLLGLEVRRTPRAQLRDALDEDVALLVLSHVDYTTGARLDMRQLTSEAHAVGALSIWDVCHSAGAIRVDLRGCGVDLAAGCGYKFLNGGPGAPAWLFVSKHLQSELSTPITGWMGAADTFGFAPEYGPAPGVARFLAGTPGILGLTTLETALEVWRDVDLDQVESKSAALTGTFMQLVEEADLPVASPRDGSLRAAQVSLRHPHAGAVRQALAAAGVVCDSRPPDVLRFGFAPLYTRFVDAWDAATALREVVGSGAWDRPEFRTASRIP